MAEEHQIAGLKKSPYLSGLKADLSDVQVRSFLECLNFTSLALFCFVLIRRLVSKYLSLRCSLLFYSAFGLLFSGYIHGAGFLYLLIITILNYFIIKIFSGKKGFPLILWVLNLAFLTCSYHYQSFQFIQIWDELEFLDLYPVLIRWHSVQRFFTLKIISFGIDLHWMKQGKLVPTHEEHKQNCWDCKDKRICLRYRTESHSSVFSFLTYLSYCYYIPLYVSGPIVPYNAWVSQVVNPQKTHTLKSLFFYLLRLILVFFILIWLVHYIYFPAIANHYKNRAVFERLTPYELTLASSFILIWISVKFTVIWKYFRVSALLDGVESCENIRCVDSQFWLQGLYRSWHRALNEWLVRYLYIPLGGSQYKFFNIWAVFGFAAIWHGLEVYLIIYAFGTCLMILLETSIKSYFQKPELEDFRKTLRYTWLCAASGGCYIYLLIIANLARFSFELPTFFNKFFSLSGVLVLFTSLVFLTVLCRILLLFTEGQAYKEPKNKRF